jgi:hypothetical protein
MVAGDNGSSVGAGIMGSKAARLGAIGGGMLLAKEQFVIPKQSFERRVVAGYESLLRGFPNRVRKGLAG